MEVKMMKRYFVIIGVIAMFCIAAGCAQPLTRLEMDYGTSFKLAKFNQVLNPEAEKNLKPVTGLDGVAAQKSIDRYRKEFEKAQPPVSTPMPSIVGIGVGGGK
jgi:hypothetical protein